MHPRLALLALLLVTPLLAAACCGAPEERAPEPGSTPAETSAKETSAPPEAPAAPPATGPTRLLRAEGRLQVRAALTPRGFALEVGDPENLLPGDPLTCIWTITTPTATLTHTLQSDEAKEIYLWREWGGSCALSSSDLAAPPAWPLEGDITFHVSVKTETHTYLASVTFHLDATPLPDGDAFAPAARKAGWTLEDNEGGLQTVWGYTRYGAVLAPAAAQDGDAAEVTISYGLLPQGAYVPCTVQGFAGPQCCFPEEDKLTGTAITPLPAPCANTESGAVCCLRGPARALALYGEPADADKLKRYAGQLKGLVE